MCERHLDRVIDKPDMGLVFTQGATQLTKAKEATHSASPSRQLSISEGVQSENQFFIKSSLWASTSTLIYL